LDVIGRPSFGCFPDFGLWILGFRLYFRAQGIQSEKFASIEIVATVLLKSMANIFWFVANFSGRLSAISRARRKWLCDRALSLLIAGIRTQAIRGAAGNPWKNLAGGISAVS